MSAGRGAVVAAAALAFALAGCRDRRAAPPEPSEPAAGLRGPDRVGNLISNGGFESGLAPWFVPRDDVWHEGETTHAPVHGGRASLAARLRGEAGARGQQRWGAMYEVGTVPFPRAASLWYRVDRWAAANAPQYLLFAVIVAARGETTQMRYFLAGVDAIPYNERGNARFVLVRPGPPETGRWVRFTADLHRDFQERWGHVPAGFESLRFAIEARFDAARPLDRAVAADVYFDDVQIGWDAADAAPAPAAPTGTTPAGAARP